MNFQTIESILKHYDETYTDAKELHFQTIESILKQYTSRLLFPRKLLFPDYWVYFKARFLHLHKAFQKYQFPDYWVYFKAGPSPSRYIEILMYFQTIESILKRMSIRPRTMSITAISRLLSLF